MSALAQERAEFSRLGCPCMGCSQITAVDEDVSVRLASVIYLPHYRSEESYALRGPWEGLWQNPGMARLFNCTTLAARARTSRFEIWAALLRRGSPLMAYERLPAAGWMQMAAESSC